MRLGNQAQCAFQSLCFHLSCLMLVLNDSSTMYKYSNSVEVNS
jgi:hypothetical protein